MLRALLSLHIAAGAQADQDAMADAQKSSSLLSMMLVEEGALLGGPAAGPEAASAQAAGTVPAAAAPDAVFGS